MRTITLTETVSALTSAGIKVWQKVDGDKTRTRIYDPKGDGYLVLERVIDGPTESVLGADGYTRSVRDEARSVSRLQPKVGGGKVSGSFAARVREVCQKI